MNALPMIWLVAVRILSAPDLTIPVKILQLCYKTNEVVSQFDLFEEVARAFDGSGHEFIFGVLTGEPDPALAARVGCATEYFGLSKRELKSFNLGTLVRLVTYIRRHRIDVVITHRYKPCLLAALASPLLPDCRFVAVFHGYKQFDRRSRQWLARLFFNQRWRVVAVSEAVQRDLIEHRIPAERIVVIPNAVDSAGIEHNQFHRDEARRQLSLPADAIVVGALGGTRAVKGHRYLLDAFAQVAPIQPHLALLLLGGGELEAALREQAERLGIADRVTITGMIANGYRYLPAVDVFVQPSLSEGLPIAVLEAMATRLPVIGTRVGGIPETVGAFGLLVPSADSAALAGALQELLSWPVERRAEQGAALHARLNSQFTIEAYHQRYRALVNELCGATTHATP